MFSRLFLTFAALAFVPSIASAAEPSKGTVITIASIGAWVLFSSLGLVLRRKRDERSKSIGSAGPGPKA